jgi:hypothetical protein
VLQAIWRSYWQAHDLDPRKNPTRPLAKGKGTRERMYNFSPNTQGLHSKRHLISFWNSLTADGTSTVRENHLPLNSAMAFRSL